MNLSNLRQSITAMTLGESISLIGDIRTRRREKKVISSPKVVKAKKENSELRSLISNLTQEEISTLLTTLEGKTPNE